ncbi:Hypothetical protein A7982_02121 [Minicystis rosea]|nr:Hypothetical protein A7982_02121 [Minicystis rosea]
MAWVEQRIAEHRPGEQLERGLGAQVQALAEALSGITNGSGDMFGMHGSAAVITARDRLEPLLRDALSAWDQRLAAEHGAEGTEAFRTIVSRFGLRLWDRAPGLEPTADDLALVARIAAQLEDLDTLTAVWREADRVVEPDDVVCVEIGEPDAEGLDTLADAYTRSTGAPFPALLHALWSKLNGVSMCSTDGDSEKTVVPPRELSEPTLWPVNVWDQHWWDVDPDAHLFVIGGLPDSGRLALRVVDASPDPEVVWIGRHEQPRLLAPNLAAFLDAWAGAAFCLPLALRRGRVPGWGG